MYGRQWGARTQRTTWARDESRPRRYAGTSAARLWREKIVKDPIYAVFLVSLDCEAIVRLLVCVYDGPGRSFQKSR